MKFIIITIVEYYIFLYSHWIFSFWNQYWNLSLMSSSAPFCLLHFPSQSRIMMRTISLIETPWQIDYDDDSKEWPWYCFLWWCDNLAKTVDENVKCNHHFSCCIVYWAVISLVAVATISNHGMGWGEVFMLHHFCQLHSLQLFQWSRNYFHFDTVVRFIISWSVLHTIFFSGKFSLSSV